MVLEVVGVDAVDSKHGARLGARQPGFRGGWPASLETPRGFCQKIQAA